MGYWRFVVDNRRFLGFGLLLAFGSSFGQTFFIALFGAELRVEFDLSHGGFGTLYSLATLASAGCLFYLGPKIDVLDLRLFSVLVCIGLGLACVLMGSANSVWVLALAIVLLRLSGQGLLGHTAATSMARYFERQRGKAISIASLGHSVGEALLPAPAVLLAATLGWRWTWTATGIVLILTLVPVVLWLLRGHGERHRRLVEDTDRDAGAGASVHRQWTRREVLGDPWFYRVLPAVLSPPFIMTGLFFHQAHLADAKGWSLAWLAACFAGFALTAVVGSLGAGVLVDRLGARVLLAHFLMPLGLALGVLVAFGHPAAALAYMSLAGLSAGAAFAVSGSLWAEVYGVIHVGAIRSLVSTLMVFSTALSPPLLGWLIDAGVSMEIIAALCLTCVVAGVSLAAWPRGATGERVRLPPASRSDPGSPPEPSGRYDQ